ncbi:MAG TPA: transporter [Parachlamydiales bacterium]|nr:transporter [Parachlamydiales bacterium]
MFRKMPFILLSLMAFIGLLNPCIPLNIQSILYAISLSIKSAILLCLPFIIFGLLFKTTMSFSQKASSLIPVLLAAICASNFLSTLISYSVGQAAYQFDLSMPFPSEGSELIPAWTFAFPKLLGNDWALLSGLFSGVLLGRLKPSWSPLFIAQIDRGVNWLLKGILYAIPLFISGFFIKMVHDKMIGHILQNYGKIFALTACSLLAYISLIYWLASRNGKLSFFQSFKNMLPAALAGFGSMSSAAAMPLTLLAVEKNSRHPDLARSIIPATVNVHLIGDCFAIPIFAFAILKSFGVAQPDFFSYLIFAVYFVLAKFSVAAVPGGGILVMLPILERYLQFNPTMLSLITALYILFDPIITCANVLGNGGFAMNLSKRKIFTRESQLL